MTCRTLIESGQVGFALGAFDVSQPLTIDPILSYSTYLGGSGEDVGRGIAIDSAGNAYVAGFTLSGNFPHLNALQSEIVPGVGVGRYDSFLAKLNPTGSALLYSTYLGGSSEDRCLDVAADDAGNAYVTGFTYTVSISDFPHTTGAFQTASGGIGGRDAFVTKLNTTASGTASLVYSTYLGGSGWDGGNDANPYDGIAVDTAGNAYVSSVTTSSNFPLKSPLSRQGTFHGVKTGYEDAIVAKINTSLTGTTSTLFKTETQR